MLPQTITSDSSALSWGSIVPGHFEKAHGTEHTHTRTNLHASQHGVGGLRLFQVRLLPGKQEIDLTACLSIGGNRQTIKPKTAVLELI